MIRIQRHECPKRSGPGEGRLRGRRRSRAHAMALAVAAIALLPTASHGQRLKFGTHRDLKIPDYATVRIGPFYSTVAFQQTVGARYVSTVGAGVAFLDENERGEVRRDGWEIPVVSELGFRNYLLVTRKMDLDMSIGLRYEHYPLATQDDRFDVDIAEEGIEGTLSTEFKITERIDGTVYDTFRYETDYIDARGLTDEYGGVKFAHFANRAGVNLDWMLAKKRNAAVTFFREDIVPERDTFERQERTTYLETIGYKQVVFPGLAAGVRGVFAQSHYPARDRSDTFQAGLDLLVDFSRGLEGAAIRLTDRTSLALELGLSTGYAERHAILETDGSTTLSGGGAQNVALTAGAQLTSRLTQTTTQMLGYRTGLRPGYDFAFERYSKGFYSLSWQWAYVSAQLESSVVEVDPTGNGAGEYSDWVVKVSAVYPIIRGVALNASSTYGARNNSGVIAAVDETLRSDYSTWISGIGTSFALTKKIALNTYAQHVERYSTTEALEYTREIFAATLVYRHQF